MPNWKKLIVSGSDANLNSLNVTTSITGSDVKIDDWGSISGSLANLTDNTPDGSGTANYVTKWSDSDTLSNSTIYDNAGIITIGSTQQGWSGNKLNIGSTSDGAAGMNILTSATGNAYIIFSDAVDGSASEYANQIRYSHTDNFLAIQTEGTERLRIKSGGNVGIGTSDPALRLHVHGTARATNLLLGDSSTANTPTIPLFIKSSGTNARMRIEDSDGTNTSYDFLVNQGAGLSIIEGSTTRMYIEEGGNVGIGTTSPGVKLEVVGNTTITDAAGTTLKIEAKNDTAFNDPRIEFVTWNVASGASSGKIQLTNGTFNSNDMAFFTETGNSVTEKMRIASTGNVGIGTAAPSAELHVYKEGNSFIKIDSGATSPYMAGVEFLRSSINGGRIYNDGAAVQVKLESYYGYESANPTRGGFTFKTAPVTSGTLVDALRINALGDVGIGTTTPSAKLEVYSSGSTVFEVNGSQGQLFSITDSLSGSLFSVSDISGTPLFEVESDSTVTLGDYNTNTLVVTGSLVGIGKGDPDYKLHVKDNQDSSLQSGIVVERSANTQKAYFNVVGGAANIVADTNIPIKVRHGSTTRLEINTSGDSTFFGNVESQDTFILNYNNAGNKWQQLFDGANGWNLRYYNGTTEAWSPNYLNVSTAGNATFAGDVTVAGTLTAQEFHTEFVSASIVYESGSTKFGNTVDDNHDFTGSLNILAQSGASGIQLDRSSNTYININNSSTRNEFNFKSSAGLRFYHGTDSTSPLFISSSGNVGIGTSSPLSRLTVAGGTGTTFNDGTLQVVGTIAMVSTSNLNAALNRWVLRPRAAGVDGTFDIYDARHSLTRLAINNSGQVKLPAYGSGTHTGTLASTLGVDSSGNIIEFTGGGGGSVSAITSGADTRVAYFNGTDSLEGSANFTWDDSKLQINKATIGEYLRVGSGGLRELRFSTYNTTSDHAGHKIDASSSNGEIAFATGGSARMYIGNTGNVGIGTASPTGNLHVEGTYGRWKLNGYGGMYFNNNSDTNNTRYIHPRSNGGLSIGRGLTASLTGTAPNEYFTTDFDQLYIKGDGKVGIGTSTPVSPLTVKSNSVSSGESGIIVQANGNTNSIIKLGERGTDGGRFEMLDANVTKIALYTDGTDNYINAGNVGIGTTSPSSKLYIRDTSVPSSGDIITSKIYSVGNTAANGNTRTGLDVETNRSGWFNSDATSGNFKISSDNRIGNSDLIGVKSLATVDVDNVYSNVAAGGSLTAFYGKVSTTFTAGSGPVTEAYGLRIDAPEVAVNSEIGTYYGAYIDGASVSGTLTNKYALVTEATAGNVGFGVTSPASKFEVYGGSSGVNDVDRYVRFKASNGEKRFDFHIGGTGNASRLDMYSSDGTSRNVQIASGGTSYLKGGNVGIGTSNPTHLLTLETASSPGLKIKDTTQGATLLAFSQDSNSHIGTYSSHPLVFDTNSTERMRITSAGNIGIGTGVASVVGGTAKVTINAINAPVSIVNGTTDGMYIRRFDTDGHYQLQTTVGAGNSGTLSLQTYGGDVGIGTTSPSFNLHVNSASNGVTAIGVGNTGTGASRVYLDASNGDFAGSDYMWIGQNNDLSGEIFMPQSAGSFHIKTQPGGTSTTQFTVNQAGNVGIGSSSPAYKLDVAGDIQNNGVLRRGGNVFIKSTGSETMIGPAGSGIISFHNSATMTTGDETVRIDANGNLLLNNTSAGARLDIREDTNYAIRAEDATGHYFRVNTGGDVDMRGDLVVQGTITAQQFHSEFVSASIIYDSGSTKFGDTSDDNHDFTGSLNLLGSAEITGDIQLVNKSDALIFGSGGSNGTWGAPKIGRIDSNLIISDYSGVQLGGYDGSAYGPRMTVKGTGNVGIGTTSPAGKLHVYGGRSYFAPQGASNSGVNSHAAVFYNPHDSAFNANALAAYNAHTSWDIESRSTFTISPRTKDTSIYTYAGEHATATAALNRFVQFNSNNTNALHQWNFYQYDGTGTAATDLKKPSTLWRVSSYDVGVSTQKLILSGDGDLTITGDLDSSDVTIDGWGSVSASLASISDAGGVNGSGTATYLTKWVDSDTVTSSGMFQAASGNFSIGISTPNAKLSVVNDISIGTSATDVLRLHNESGVGTIDGYSTRNIAFGSATNGEVMRIDNTNGRVGIGTTSPGSRLTVSGTDNATSEITLINTNPSTDNDWSITPFYNDQTLRFRTNSAATTVMTLKDNGNVGIGTTAPKQLFHVHGGSTAGSVTKAVIGGTGGNGESYLYLAEHFSGDNVNYGFSFVTDGNSSNNLLIKRHSNSTSGVTVLTINRDNSDASFSGALQVGSNLDVNGTSLTLSSAAITYQNNNDVDTGTETIATVVKANHDAAFFDYVVKNGTNLRAGTVIAVHDGTNVEFTDNSTKDIGDTSGVTFSVDISGTDLRLRATTTSDNWVIKTLVKSI